MTDTRIFQITWIFTVIKLDWFKKFKIRIWLIWAKFVIEFSMMTRSSRKVSNHGIKREFILFKKFCVKIFSNKFFFPCVDTICVVRPYLMFSDVLHKSYFPTNAFAFASAFFCQKWDFPHINTIFLKYDIVKEIVHDYTIKNLDWYVRCYFERI